ncbi:hypothetical protein M427DRAFT_36449 [Gonapodya prolifera JEL478]|uniref:Uncharacterized protein n=1 Tax=Gonapodya prolifera (strain JEL478) TaxID=1344416 RepID=A0A139A2M9_GONPJ|nr:hypothetical protein M427DRAFT_36449 [Gonapodya prolifera JEL478]|eukprot:KXS10994.1 hypothetical protein M427DRAFT_36449 [Gonapodya prolifera JEL478]
MAMIKELTWVTLTGTVDQLLTDLTTIFNKIAQVDPARPVTKDNKVAYLLGAIEDRYLKIVVYWGGGTPHPTKLRMKCRQQRTGQHSAQRHMQLCSATCATGLVTTAPKVLGGEWALVGMEWLGDGLEVIIIIIIITATIVITGIIDSLVCISKSFLNL